jgi:glycosyltransferase involved in cell wall biosynthesis
LGRISPEKRLDRAIAIARAVGLPLKIAAKVDRADEAYFRREIVPLLAGTGIEFIGEINERQKGRFLGNAGALLFPIDWPEPFGLMMIEAMACGTPVLAFRKGSVAEVVEDGITGYIVNSVDEAICKIGRLLSLDRSRVRRGFEERFTARRMVQNYIKIYEKLISTRACGTEDRAGRRWLLTAVRKSAANQTTFLPPVQPRGRMTRWTPSSGSAARRPRADAQRALFRIGKAKQQ